MKDLIVILVWVVVVGAAFAFAWHRGYLAKVASYVAETQEELRKCAWPSTEELKGSTAVVLSSILLMGLFTVVVDFVLSHIVRAIL